MSIVSARNLKKFYWSSVTRKHIPALQGVSLEVEPGEIFGILGPNGAGKTTLLNCLSLLLVPDQGEVVHFNGAKLSPNQIRSRINMTSGHANFPWSLTALETLKFYAYLYGLHGKILKERMDELISLLELEPILNQRFDELSTGSKQRLALAKSLINDPEILFLDEPTVGLDPDVSMKIRRFVEEVNQKKKITILLTTHYMSEAEQLTHCLAFLQKGQILAMVTPEELKNRLSAKNMEEVFLHLVSKR